MSSLKNIVSLLSGTSSPLTSILTWGWQFALTLGVLAWFGHWMDQRYETKVLFVLIGLFMGLFGGFYRLFRIVSVLSNQQKKKDTRQ